MKTWSIVMMLLVSPLLARADDAPDMIATVNLVPSGYRHRLVQQLSVAEDNQPNLLNAIGQCPADHREAMAFLVVNMPERDLKSLKSDYLLRNVDLAYKAREATDWGKKIPTEIFFKDVLPYVNVNETREDWRPAYFEKFLPVVKNTKSAAEAALLLNKSVFNTIHVHYHATKRLKPDQSPSESTQIGYASCTGLSIILSDACRAVGVPARVVGVPQWTDQEGNHTWTEIWDGSWHFVGSSESGPLDQTWFKDSAAKADESDANKRIYAVSFASTGTSFPMIWKPEDTSVFGKDVTRFYTSRKTLTVTGPADAAIEIRSDNDLIAAGAPGKYSLASGEKYLISWTVGSSKNSKKIELPKGQDLTVDLSSTN